MICQSNPIFGEFKTHFLNSPIYQQLINDPAVEVVMVYLTGSYLTGNADCLSDYDLCVLVASLPRHLEVYQRPPMWYMQYTPEGRKCHVVYNDFSNIFKTSAFPQDNVGWVQFKYITDEHIFYTNPKYQQMIQILLSHKDEISQNALHLFGISCLSALSVQSVEAITEDLLQKVPKLAYQLVWASGEACGIPVSPDLLIPLKRQSFVQLPENAKNQVLTCIKTFAQYIEAYSKSGIIKELEKFYDI